jgi:hypothetical protein
MGEARLSDATRPARIARLRTRRPLVPVAGHLRPLGLTAMASATVARRHGATGPVVKRVPHPRLCREVTSRGGPAASLQEGLGMDTLRYLCLCFQTGCHPVFQRSERRSRHAARWRCIRSGAREAEWTCASQARPWRASRHACQCSASLQAPPSANVVPCRNDPNPTSG